MKRTTGLKRGCGKRRYRDEVAARVALARIEARDDAKRDKQPCRAYPCRCGGWHLTSMTTWTPKPSRDGGFTAKVRLLVRTRAGDGDPGQARCEACGVHLGRHGGQVQHVIARGMGGTSLPVMGSAANGALLCGNPLDNATCHGRAEHRDIGMWRRGFWEHHGTDPRNVARQLWDGRTVFAREDGTWGMEPQEAAA